MDRGAWQATVHGVIRVGHDLVTKAAAAAPPVANLGAMIEQSINNHRNH